MALGTGSIPFGAVTRPVTVVMVPLGHSFVTGPVVVPPSAPGETPWASASSALVPDGPHAIALKAMVPKAKPLKMDFAELALTTDFPKKRFAHLYIR